MIEAELGRFGDRRLACVGGALLAAMRSKRTLCVHRLAKDRKQTIQFGRFLANRAVTVHEMLVTAGRSSNQRAAGRHVLAIMDTTDLRFPTHEASKRGFGRDANDTCPGLFLHPILAVDADNGGVIGLVDCVVLNRTEGKVTGAPGDWQEERVGIPYDERQSEPHRPRVMRVTPRGVGRSVDRGAGGPGIEPRNMLSGMPTLSV